MIARCVNGSERALLATPPQAVVLVGSKKLRGHRLLLSAKAPAAL